MAELPSSESSARYILSIFVNNGARAGDVFQARNFKEPFSIRGWRDTDFQDGIAYAIEKKWIENASPASYRLTETGFAEA
jgi:hypothetical protein